MERNIDGSKVMVIPKQGIEKSLKVTLGGKELEKVNGFDYLGTILTMDRKVDDDVNNRTKYKPNLLLSIRCNRGKERSYRRPKKHIYHLYQIYGKGIPMFVEKHKTRHQASEMRFLTRVAEVNLETQSSKTVNDEDGRHEGNFMFRHVVRKSQERKRKQVLKAHPKGKT